MANVSKGKKGRSLEERAATMATNHYDLLFGLINQRISSGMTQQDVADKLGITQQAVAKFESMDSDPRMSTIRHYALAVGATFSIKIEN